MLGAVGVIHPITTIVPVRNMTEQRGDLAVIDDACRIIGPHAAVVIVRGPITGFNRSGPQALRGWCGADVAVMTSRVADRDLLARLATAWEREGRPLWVVSDDVERDGSGGAGRGRRVDAGGDESVLPAVDARRSPVGVPVGAVLARAGAGAGGLTAVRAQTNCSLRIAKYASRSARLNVLRRNSCAAHC